MISGCLAESWLTYLRNLIISGIHADTNSDFPGAKPYKNYTFLTSVIIFDFLHPFRWSCRIIARSDNPENPLE